MSRKSEPTDDRIDGEREDAPEGNSQTTEGREFGRNGQQPDGTLASGFSRRGALAALTGLGALGLGSGTASAGSGDHLGETWTGDPSANHGLKIEATSDTQFGFQGFSNASDGRGVYGEARTTTGTNYGVQGRTASSGQGSAGVRGDAFATSGTIYGVRGQTNSTDGYGVAGLALADSGETVGVVGRTDSSSNGAIGVRGQASAASGRTWGVRGHTHSSEGRGVLGRAFSDTGETVGVKGKVESTSGTAVHALNTTGEQALEAEGDADVTGVLTVGKLGAEAYLGTTQTVLAGGVETVVFDTEVIDDRGEYSTSNGTFTADYAGSYVVTTQVTWANPSSGKRTSIRIRVNGNDVALKEDFTPSTNPYSVSLSKTVRDLSVGDVIDVQVENGDSSDWDLATGQIATWVEISQVG